MNIYRTLLFSFSILFLTACKGTDEADRHSGAKTITVSIEPQREVVNALAGDEYEVVTVLERGANPETFEPSMSRRLAIDKSVAYLMIDAFPFEESLSNSLKDNIHIYNTAEGIELLYGTHCHHSDDEACDKDHDEMSADPHLWTSVNNMSMIALNTAKALCLLNPDNSELYCHKLDSLMNTYNHLDRQIEEKLSELSSRSFLIWHPSLSYFSRDYNLHQIAVGQESKEISPRQLKEIIDEAIADSVDVFFFQKEFDSRQATTISDRTNARLVTIDPLAFDWKDQIIRIADELAK